MAGVFNGFFGIGRAYKKLPPHRNFEDLARNMEGLADYLLDRAVRDVISNPDADAVGRWEWKLGHDLKMLVEYARAYVPEDADGAHYLTNLADRRRKAAGQPK